MNMALLLPCINRVPNVSRFNSSSSLFDHENDSNEDRVWCKKDSVYLIDILFSLTVSITSFVVNHARFMNFDHVLRAIFNENNIGQR